jgi:hypothetical protein
MFLTMIIKAKDHDSLTATIKSRAKKRVKIQQKAGPGRSLVESIDQVLVALMVEAISTSETSVNLCKIIRRNIPEVSILRTLQIYEIRQWAVKIAKEIFLNFLQIKQMWQGDALTL